MKKNRMKRVHDEREAFRSFLVGATGCDVQEGADRKPWPCGTCVRVLLDKMGLDDTKPEYYEYNKSRDRHNEVWRAIIQIREASLKDRRRGKR